MATAQETAIYDALNAGDQDAIAQLRDAAYAVDQAPPDPEPDDWSSPAEQFEADYLNAWTHYQSDHEAPEGAREVATKVEVQQENVEAG